MNKISVIIPAYNSSSKIGNCLDSIINQTYKDLEIIVVDDSSQDNTLEVIQEYAKRDSRIKIIKNSINRGAGYSRNRALDIATGNYITFVDSDDYLDLNTYEGVIDTIKKEDPDIIRYDQISLLNAGNLQFNIDFFTNNIFNGARGVLNPKQHPYYVALESPGVCNKVFKRELIGNTRFIEDTKWEDYPFCTFLLAKASKVAFSSIGKYNYCHSVKADNTTLGDVKKPSNRMLEIFDCCDFLEQEYKDEELYDIFEPLLRGNQKINSLQRARDIMFSRKYSHLEKKKLINNLINLIEVKYGEPFQDPFYLKLKKEKTFYRTRMILIEDIYSDSSTRKDNDEKQIKRKIKGIIAK